MVPEQILMHQLFLNLMDFWLIQLLEQELFNKYELFIYDFLNIYGHPQTQI